MYKTGIGHVPIINNYHPVVAVISQGRRGEGQLVGGRDTGISVRRLLPTVGVGRCAASGAVSKGSVKTNAYLLTRRRYITHRRRRNDICTLYLIVLRAKRGAVECRQLEVIWAARDTGRPSPCTIANA